jgi:hypothetical protein
MLRAAEELRLLLPGLLPPILVVVERDDEPLPAELIGVGVVAADPSELVGLG